MQRIRVVAGFFGAAMIALAPSAMAQAIDGTGAVGTCPTTGKISIKPGLVAGGTLPDALKIGTKTPKLAICSGGTGDGAHIVSAKSKGTGTGTTNNCSTLLGPQPSNLSITVKWKTDGTVKLNPSTITLTSQTGGISSTPPAHGSFVATGTVTAGSFTGDSVSATIVTDQDLVEISTACGTAMAPGKGLKKISFGAKPSKDDGQIGSGSVTIN
jgi:hypothetical protein